MAETPLHRKNMTDLIQELETFFKEDAEVYVSGNMFVYYVPGDRLRHVSPDVFAVRGIPKETIPARRRYLVWEEGKSPEVVIELTSESTREEDIDDKFDIYQDKLRVKEYFLFDPYAEYLDPQLQGYRLRKGQYVRIRSVKGRLPSQVLGLHLEADGEQLRLYDPDTRLWLPTPDEVQEALIKSEAERKKEATARKKVEDENERLRQEIEALKRRLSDKS